MAAGAPLPEYAAVWAKEATDAGTLHVGPVKQGKGLLVMHVCAARHARLAQHRRHGSHGMGQQVKLAGRCEVELVGRADLRDHQGKRRQG